MRTGVIVQARLGSTRFPNKVIAMIEGRSVVHHVIERAQQIGADTVVAAIPEGRDDDLLDYHLATQLKVPVYRGHPTDVLRRFRYAAAHFSLDAIVRITADCPLIDPTLAALVLEPIVAGQATYSSNVYPDRTFPDGLDCEAFTRTALEEAHEYAVALWDREHVTPYIMRTAGDLGRRFCLRHTTNLSAVRWTLDTVHDLARIRAIAAKLPDEPTYTMQETMLAAEAAGVEIGEP